VTARRRARARGPDLDAGNLPPPGEWRGGRTKRRCSPTPCAAGA